MRTLGGALWVILGHTRVIQGISGALHGFSGHLETLRGLLGDILGHSRGALRGPQGPMAHHLGGYDGYSNISVRCRGNIFYWHLLMIFGAYLGRRVGHFCHRLYFF